jgi:hypothetical protein
MTRRDQLIRALSRHSCESRPEASTRNSWYTSGIKPIECLTVSALPLL